MKTFRQFVEEAFSTAELVRALETMNTPTDYEERKKAFVQLAEARRVANIARQQLENAIEKNQ